MYLRFIPIICSLSILLGCDTLQSASNPFRPTAEKRAERQVRPSPAPSQPVPARPAWPQRNDANGNRFQFVIQSDPSGADVFRVDGTQTIRLGKTPLTFPLIIERDRSHPFFFLMPRQWVARGNRDLPLTFTQLQHTILVQTPELQLQLDGYDPQRFTHRWNLPDD
jgi:hypothetical protein